MKIVRKEEKDTTVILDVEFEEDPYRGQLWNVQFAISCEDPTCPCTNLAVTARAVDTQEALDFMLNVADRKITGAAGTHSTTESGSFSKSLIAELPEDEWGRLYKFLYTHKNKKFHEIEDSHTLQADFGSWEADIADSICIPFQDFFPYSEQIFLHGEESCYFLYDQYCVNPSCSCRDVLVSFYPYRKKEDLGDCATILYHYVKNSWEFVEKESEEEASRISRLLKEQRSRLTELGRTFKKRHRILRGMYERYKEKSQQALPAEDLSPRKWLEAGRNDPCPCGSGLKFKKCCGR
jgi:hypothetical protein